MYTNIIDKSIAEAQKELNGRLNFFSHMLDNQMIDLKYGKDYLNTFLNGIIKVVEQL